MKQLYTLCAAILTVSLLLPVGCSGAKEVKESDLMNRRFSLESVDGQIYVNATNQPDIEFGESFRVYGSVCNRYTGQGELKGQTFTLKQGASTKMLCVDEALNTLENQFLQMVAQGTEISLSGDKLTLKGSGHTLVYTLVERRN